MAKIIQLTGISDLTKAVAAKGRQYAGGMERGLLKVGLYLQGESQSIVPVDLGNLRASAFTRQTGHGFQTEVRVGYTAEYSIYVHEMIATRSGQSKFLEEPARTKVPEMRAIFRKEVGHKYE